MSRQITLLSNLSGAGPEGDVGLLFECAADGSARQRFPHAIPLHDLIGDPETVRHEAFVLARRLLRDEPLLRGIGQLGVFDEMLMFQLPVLLHARRLCDFLIAGNYDTCLLNGHTRLLQAMQWFIRQSGQHIEISSLPANVNSSAASSVLKRSWDRLKDSGFEWTAVAGEWRQILDRIDPYHRRASIRPKRYSPRHCIWFYSTAYTFTRTGMAYEPYFPEPFKYLIENPLTGGLPLKEVRRSFSSPYDYVTSAMRPDRREVDEARSAILEHLRSVKLAPVEGSVRDAYLDGPNFKTFMDRLLPKGLLQTTLFEEFVDNTRPSALVVGNAVFEGYALHAARKAGIPTCLLQHGTLGEFCQFVDPPVDQYVVRGSFWQKFVEAKQGAQVRIINPPDSDPHIIRPEVDDRRSVLFLTAPYSIQEFWDDSDLEDILESLLLACGQDGAELIIRVHPLEKPGHYKQIVERLSGQVRDGHRVSFSQGGDLDGLIRRSAVAVTYSSTVFLDCLRHRIPVISFDWHDFDYKHNINEHGVFHFCTTLDALQRMVQSALRGELHAYAASVEPFIAGMSGDEVRNSIRGILATQEPTV